MKGQLDTALLETQGLRGKVEATGLYSTTTIGARGRGRR
jgi:hypothetical protein